MGSSLTRNWTRVSSIGRRILYHWATREALAGRFLMTGPSGKSWCSAFKCASQPTHNSDCREWKPCWLEVSEHNLCPNHWCTNKLWRYGRDFGQLSTPLSGSKTKQQGSEQSLQWLHSLGKRSLQFWIKLVTYWNQEKKKKEEENKIQNHYTYYLQSLLFNKKNYEIHKET